MKKDVVAGVADKNEIVVYQPEGGEKNSKTSQLSQILRQFKMKAVETSAEMLNTIT
jgi:hypothetical protein